jgi:hypothetical protein
MEGELDEREPTTRQKDAHAFAYLARFGRYSKYFSSKYVRQVPYTGSESRGIKLLNVGSRKSLFLDRK